MVSPYVDQSLETGGGMATEEYLMRSMVKQSTKSKSKHFEISIFKKKKKKKNNRLKRRNNCVFLLKYGQNCANGKV